MLDGLLKDEVYPVWDIQCEYHMYYPREAACVRAKAIQSCPTLCEPMDGV